MLSAPSGQSNFLFWVSPSSTDPGEWGGWNIVKYGRNIGIN